VDIGTAREPRAKAALPGRAAQRCDNPREVTEQQAPDLVPRVVDHIGFAVADYERSKAFYERALAPLRVTLLMEFAGAAAGFGKSGRPSFFIEAHGEPLRGRLHIALRAETRAQVDAFHAAAIEAGGTDNGAPGVRPIYHPDYYGAYVLDPDGNNIEAVCHQPE
jgi:catechol 2,3-dioxygenase-like lactoylglutathione lyase family enzyme